MMAADGRPFLTAEWRDLVLLNYLVDPAILRPFLPAGLELDFWSGGAWVSLVGFRFLKTRVRGVPVPFHRDFDEVNLRFYVRRGERRGVVFIKEIVPKRAIAWIARAVYRENYVRLPMRHEISETFLEYSWRHPGGWSRIRVDAPGPAQPLAASSHEEFIAEHYWGYVRHSADRTVEYRVDHVRWRIRAAGSASVDADFAGLYPPEFEALARRRPDSAFVAEGSQVAVFPGIAM